MKKIVILLALIFFTTLVTNAQDTIRQRDQTKTKIQKRDRIHQEEHLQFMDGKLYRYQNGVRSQVQSQVQLKNGGSINPDGSYQLKNQERMQLRNGECLDMEGNRYQNQKMFNQRHMMMQKGMQQNRNMNMQKKQINQNRGGGRRS